MAAAGSGSRHLETRLSALRLALWPEPEKAVRELLAQAGITVNGSQPWDIRVHQPRLYARVLAQGSIGLGEGYMDGDWSCPALDEFFARVIGARLGVRLGLTLPLALLILSARVKNRQTVKRAKDVAKVHYDLPVDIFEATFDRRLTGSCGYWKEAGDLDAAQEAKLDLICRKIGLRREHSVLDIGCGWGAFLGYAAEKYGADCTGVTISPVQVDYIRQHYGALAVHPQLLDYRELCRPQSRPAGVDGNVRACRLEEFPHLFRMRAQISERRRVVPAPHHRRE